MSDRGGAKKFVIRDNDMLIKSFVDSLKYATSISNLTSKLSPLFGRDFIYKVSGSLGERTGGKRDFYRFAFNRQKIYEEGRVNVKKESENSYLITFKHNTGLSLKLLVTIANYKIKRIDEEESIKRSRNLTGGQGYSYNVSINPVAGKPVVSPYYQCCRPIFFGDLLKGGSRKQKGGRNDTGYRFDLQEENLLNVLPQYRAYSHQ